MTDVTSAATDLETPNIAAMSPQQAAARLQDLMQNEKWSAALTAGNGPQGQEFRALMEKKFADDARLDRIVAGTETAAPFETVANGELTTSKLMASAEQMRNFGLTDDAIKQAISDTPVSRSEFNAVKILRGDMMADKDFAAAVLSGNPCGSA
jgi:hypothetical protein